MSSQKLHPRNRHLGEKGASYDLPLLCQNNPQLTQHIIRNKAGNDSINFAESEAVKQLNRALLLTYYQLNEWDLPAGFLCPPVPGRADYIHYIADLLSESGLESKSKHIKGLDIGTGANLIYPIIGIAEYGWKFVASDIDKDSINHGKMLLQFNPKLKNALKLRLQSNSSHIFHQLIQQTDKFTFSMCNPPFHSSAEAAAAGSLRKLNNLGLRDEGKTSPELNFGGRANELWCEGGEAQFVCNMIEESQDYAQQVLWFTSLISNNDNLAVIYDKLKQVNAAEITTVNMAQGNKISRFVAWSFVPRQMHASW